jgi:ABC-type amino acid transport substrate-binding protein
MGQWLRASVVGVAVLTLFISGCAGKAKPISGPAAARRQVAKTGSALDAIAGRGELKIGVDISSAPFSSWKENSTNEFEGFAVDVGRRMTQSIFGGKATAKFKPALSDPQSELDQGLYDVLLDSWLIAFAEEEKLHRSPTYFNNSMRFLVRKDQHVAHIQDPESISGEAEARIRYLYLRRIQFCW